MTVQSGAAGPVQAAGYEEQLIAGTRNYQLSRRLVPGSMKQGRVRRESV